MNEQEISKIQPGKEEKQKSAAKLLDKIIIGSISLVFFLCPLFFTGQIIQGLGFEKMILFYFFVLVGVVTWVANGVVKGELSLKRTPLDFAILAVIIVTVASTVLSVNAKDSLIGGYGSSTKSLLAVIIFSLFYYLVVNNINKERIKFIFWSLIVSSSLVIIYSLLQLFSIYILPMDFTHFKNFNPLGSLSGLTMFLVIVLPLFVVGAAQVKEIHPKLSDKAIIAIKSILGIISLASMVVLALLNGFTFWPAAIVGIVIVLMFLLSKIIFVSSNNLVIPLATFILLITFLVIGNFNIIDLKLPAEVSLSRKVSWDIAKQSLKENPLLGSGPSTFYYDFSRFKTQDFNASPLWNVRFDNASGVFFEIMATVGSLGFLAVIVLILIILSSVFLSLIKSKETETRSILLALFASFITAILFSFLFSLNNSIILIIALISILAMSFAVVAFPEKFATVKLSFRAAPKYALALAAIFLGVSAGVVILFTMGLKMYLSDIYAKKAMMENDSNKKIEKLNKSITLFPYQETYYLELANQYMSVANMETTTGKNQAVIEKALTNAIDNGKKAVDLAPNKAASNESLALIYENASFYTRGALEWAEQYYNKVVELDPTNPVPNLRIALINMAKSNLETDPEEKKFYVNEAIKKYDEAIAKKADLSAAYYGKAVAYERLADNNQAIEQLKRAVLMTKDNIDYRFELGRLYFNRGVTQPNIQQTATKQLTEEKTINEGEAGKPAVNEEALSVQTAQPTGNTSKKNEDLVTAEQIFLSILQINPRHANSLYSLALLYKKTGENDNSKIAVQSLLSVVDAKTKEFVKQQFPGLY